MGVVVIYCFFVKILYYFSVITFKKDAEEKLRFFSIVRYVGDSDARN